MKNKDTIIRYISDLMEPEEKLEFEKRLKVDSELQTEFAKMNSNLAKITSLNKLDLDSAYFNNLVPNVRNKLSAEKPKKLISFAPAFSFGIVVLLMLLLNLPKLDNGSQFEMLIGANDISTMITETDDSVLSDYLESGIVREYNYYSNENTSDLDIYIDDTILTQIGVYNSSDYYKLNLTESIDDFSSEEVNLIYEELINKKIL